MRVVSDTKTVILESSLFVLFGCTVYSSMFGSKSTSTVFSKKKKNNNNTKLDREYRSHSLEISVK